MEYYYISAEVPGEFGKQTTKDLSKRPPVVTKLHFEFSFWRGDHLVERFPIFMISEKLNEELQRKGISSYHTMEFIKSVSLDWKEPEDFPIFKWMIPTGKVAIDDIALDQYGRLVVSEKALNIMKEVGVNYAEIKSYDPAYTPDKALDDALAVAREKARLRRENKK